MRKVEAKSTPKKAEGRKFKVKKTKQNRNNEIENEETIEKNHKKKVCS